MNTLRSRISSLDPSHVDLAIGMVLSVLVCLQIWGFSQLRPGFVPLDRSTGAIEAPMRDRVADGPFHGGRPQVDPGIEPYIFAAAAFLPLALRRRLPWLALGITFPSALVYTINPWPPAIVILGPAIAMYSLAAASARRRILVVAGPVIGLVALIALITFSTNLRWAMEAIMVFALLATAALLGETTRNRRAYIAQVEERAVEAERTREQEASRRVDEERIRIAREVHDIVAHTLSIVTVQAGAAEMLLPDQPEKARESVMNIRKAGKQAMGELRSLLDLLRTSEPEACLAPQGDLGQISVLVHSVREAGVFVDVDVRGDLSIVPTAVSVSAYRIVQEALTNVVRHAEVKHAVVRLEITDHDLTVEVTDEGKGLSGTAADDTGGHGVRGMLERTEAHGGTFAMGPFAEGGVQVQATIPFERRA